MNARLTLLALPLALAACDQQAIKDFHLPWNKPASAAADNAATRSLSSTMPSAHATITTGTKDRAASVSLPMFRAVSRSSTASLVMPDAAANVARFCLASPVSRSRCRSSSFCFAKNASSRAFPRSPKACSLMLSSAGETTFAEY